MSRTSRRSRGVVSVLIVATMTLGGVSISLGATNSLGATSSQSGPTLGAARRLVKQDGRVVSVSLEAAPAAPSPSPTPTPPPTGCSGQNVSPSDPLASFLKSGPTGTTYCLAPGTYRLTESLRPKDGTKLIAAADGVVLSGAKRLGGFTQTGNYWIAQAQTQENPSRQGYCEPNYSGCVFPEELYFDNEPLRQATSLSTLSSGEFYFDYPNDRIYVADNPAGKVVEAAVTNAAISGPSSNVTLTGTTVEKFATPSNGGAIVAGSGWLLRDNDIRLNNAAAIVANGAARIENNLIRNNGQAGLFANGSSNVVINNDFVGNNVGGFLATRYAGAMKLQGTQNLILRGNSVRDNLGNGIWLAANNSGALIENNVVQDNSLSGIVYETSYSAIIRNNTSLRNGSEAGTAVAEGAGIRIASSSNVEVTGNTLTDNAGGIVLVQNSQNSGTQGVYELRNVNVHDNDTQMMSGRTGMIVLSGGGDYYSSMGNLFRNNSYCLAGSTGKFFQWKDGPITTQQWKAAGNDLSGVFSVECETTPPPSPSPTPTPAPSASPSASPSATPTPSPSASPSATPTPAPSASPSASPSATPTPAPSASPSATPTPAPSASPSATPTPSPTPTPTPSPTSPPTSCSGVNVAPGADLNGIVDSKPQGTTFCLNNGVHRLTAPLTPKTGMSLIGQPGTELSGARILTNFVLRGSHYVVGGQTQQGALRGKCELPDGACLHPEAVFVDNHELTQVMSLNALSAGEFYLNYADNELFLADSPAGRKVEATFASAAIKGSADDVTVQGLVIEMFDNPAGAGAIHLYGSGSRILDNEIRQNGGIGVCTGGRGSQVVRNHVHHNGQMGMCGNGDNMLIANNEIDHNNTQGHRYGWEAGGSKWTNTVGLIVRNNYSHHNKGLGLWTDLNNIDTTYENNVVTDNEAIGIYHEVSYDAVIRGNTITNNGWGVDWWADGSGIKVSSSPNVEILNNTISGNRNAIVYIQYNRGLSGAYVAPVHGPHLTRNNHAHDNEINIPLGASGISGGWNYTGDNGVCAAASNNRFGNNTYRFSASGSKGFRWCGAILGWDQWRALGHDI